MSKHEQDETDETCDAPPDSGTERTRRRAEPEAADEFENDEERRFFSLPPAQEEGHTLPSLEPVVAEAEHDGAEPSPAEREWLARADARRATLQRWVGLSIVAGAVALVIAAADRYVAAHADTASHFAPAVLAAAGPTPQKKTTATPSTAGARSSHDAPSATSVPMLAPPAAPRTPSPVFRAPEPATSTAPAPDAVPLPTPSAASSVSSSVAPSTAASAPSSLTSSVASATPSSGTPSAAASAPSEADAAGLREKARSLLATGHSRDGVGFARAAVESDPADARSYVLLGAGLQDLGDWAAARDVFHECTLKATRGPSGACQYFARR